jgi:hypothetical protein
LSAVSIQPMSATRTTRVAPPSITSSRPGADTSMRVEPRRRVAVCLNTFSSRVCRLITGTGRAAVAASTSG